MRNIPVERRSHLHRCGSLKSGIVDSILTGYVRALNQQTNENVSKYSLLSSSCKQISARYVSHSEFS
jgi:hypothetical protein